MFMYINIKKISIFFYNINLFVENKRFFSLSIKTFDQFSKCLLSVHLNNPHPILFKGSEGKDAGGDDPGSV